MWRFFTALVLASSFLFRDGFYYSLSHLSLLLILSLLSYALSHNIDLSAPVACLMLTILMHFLVVEELNMDAILGQWPSLGHKPYRSPVSRIIFPYV